MSGYLYYFYSILFPSADTENQYELDIVIGGETTTVIVMVDFGMSGALRFTTRYVNDESLVDRMQAATVTENERGMGGALRSRIARLPRVHIGNTTLDSVVVSLAREEQGADAYREWDALIGLELLSRFTLYLDLSGDRLWLRPNVWIDRP